jgi:hypothetical protein
MLVSSGCFLLSVIASIAKQSIVATKWIASKVRR